MNEFTTSDWIGVCYVPSHTMNEWLYPMLPISEGMFGVPYFPSYPQWMNGCTLQYVKSPSVNEWLYPTDVKSPSVNEYVTSHPQWMNCSSLCHISSSVNEWLFPLSHLILSEWMVVPYVTSCPKWMNGFTLHLALSEWMVLPFISHSVNEWFGRRTALTFRGMDSQRISSPDSQSAVVSTPLTSGDPRQFYHRVVPSLSFTASQKRKRRSAQPPPPIFHQEIPLLKEQCHETLSPTKIILNSVMHKLFL